METLRDIGAIVQAIVFTGLAVATLRMWRAQGGEAPKWLAGAFGTLAIVVVAGLLLPDEPESTAVELLVKLNLVVLLLFPWLLFRFSATFAGVGRRTDLAAALALGAMVLATIATPPFPQQGEPQPGWLTIYLVALLAYWTGLSLRVAITLWRGGRGQTTAVRYRMRLLCFGAVLLTIVLLVGGAASGSEESVAREIATQAMVLASALLFFLGFAPPAALVAWWRGPEADAFQHAQEQLMSATTAAQVAEALLPAAARLVGGGVVLDVEGIGPLARDLDPEAVRAVVGGVPPTLPALPETVAIADGAHVAALRLGWIAVRPGPYTPLFGDEDLRQFRALAHVADLALDRVRLQRQADEDRGRLQAVQARQRQAFEINDGVVQGLVVAKMALDLGDRDRAFDALESTLAQARAIVTDLLHEVGDDGFTPGSLVRRAPVHLSGEDRIGH